MTWQIPLGFHYPRARQPHYDIIVQARISFHHGHFVLYCRSPAVQQVLAASYGQFAPEDEGAMPAPPYKYTRSLSARRRRLHHT